MTRTGKIARLPHAVREELNRRLRDGEPGGPLLEWLNAHEEVLEVLQDHFNEQPINKQNLSDWRLGGHRDWLRHQETRDLMRQLAEQGDELLEETRGEAVSDRLAPVLAAELVRTAQAVLDEVTEPTERWRRVRELLHELAGLRKDDHRAARLKLDRDEAIREDEEREQQAHAAEIRRLKQQATAPLWAALNLSTVAEAFGGGEAGRTAAALLLEVQNDLPPGFFSRKKPEAGTPAAAAPVKPSQGESSPTGPEPEPEPPAGGGATTAGGPAVNVRAGAKPQAPARQRREHPSGEAGTPDGPGKPAQLAKRTNPAPTAEPGPPAAPAATGNEDVAPPVAPKARVGFIQTLPMKSDPRGEGKRRFRPGPLSGL